MGTQQYDETKDNHSANCRGNAAANKNPGMTESMVMGMDSSA